MTNELHALIGRNGVGKSCLAAILADRLQPSIGCSLVKVLYNAFAK
ncbi:ATP-binding cassette domain-containing protein [Psychrobacter sp. ER1]